MKIWTALGVSTMLLVGAVSAFAEADGPDYWVVTGVASDDVLNIREQPDPRSTKVGEIPPDGTCIRNLECVGGLTFEEFTSLSEKEKQRILRERPRWCRIDFRGVEGWVAGRYLTEGRCDGGTTVNQRLREMYRDFAPDVFVFDAETDLDGDGSLEVVVHVVSPMLCGTGGCNTLVFTPRGAGYELVTDISVNRPPIRVSERTSNGWHNLIVHVSGGGMTGHEAELAFDGTSYPSNPSVAPATPAPSMDGAEVLIPEFETLTDGRRLFGD